MQERELRMEDFSLAGKCAVVTGGNNGLGLGYVTAMLTAGAKVLVACLDEHHWDELRAFAAERDGEVHFFLGDLTQAEVRGAVVCEAMRLFGRIDILLNNAGLIVRKPLLACEDEDFTRVMDVNCDALYFLSRLVAEGMVAQRSGKIINIASMISFRGGVGNIGYAASKHAVAGITKNFANELGQYNIQVNAIAPGYIAAGNSEEIMHDKQKYDDFLSRIPAGRWGTPGDLQGLCVFLCSSASDYVSGTIIPVDGGYLCR